MYIYKHINIFYIFYRHINKTYFIGKYIKKAYFIDKYINKYTCILTCVNIYDIYIHIKTRYILHKQKNSLALVEQATSDREKNYFLHSSIILQLNLYLLMRCE